MVLLFAFYINRDWLNLAIADGQLANEFKAVGIPSLASMPETGVKCVVCVWVGFYRVK